MDYPANIASMLLKDEIDIGLVPVAILPALKEYHIISDYCIACDGEVASVCLFSEVPVNEIQTILLDYQSSSCLIILHFPNVMYRIMHICFEITFSNSDYIEFSIWHFEPNRTSSRKPKCSIRNLFYFFHPFKHGISWIVLWNTMNEFTVSPICFPSKEFDLIMNICGEKVFDYLGHFGF